MPAIMKQADVTALALRDLALTVAITKGELVGISIRAYTDARLRIEYDTTDPHALTVWKISETKMKVLSVFWQDDGYPVVLIYRPGSWEDNLRRVAKAGG